MTLLTTKRFVWCMFFYCTIPPLFAATPVVSINLVSSSSHCTISSNGACSVEYALTNNLPQTITRPIPTNRPGITNIHPSTSALNGSCQDLDNLPAGSTCNINILVAASDLAPGVIVSGGPTIPLNPFWTSQPPPREQLQVTVTDTPAPVTLTGSNMALSVNDTGTNAALTGNPRNIVITNTSTENAENVVYLLSSSLPNGTTIGTTIGTTSCGTITANGGTCTLTVTPGQTATSSPLTLNVFGDNTNLLSTQLDILAYGSIYQSGYVFAIDDTPAATSSVLGKVAALEDQAKFWPFGLVWLSNGDTHCNLATTYANCTDYHVFSGINENSTTTGGDACNGNSDGACNTNVIVSYADGQGVSRELYAAGLCKAEIGGYSDWYLPAICEMGFYQPAPNTQNIDSGCGQPPALPLMQNMLSNLFDMRQGHLLGVTWSSTQFSGSDGTDHNSWDEYFLVPNSITNVQTHDGKEDPSGVRCVRAITQP